MDNFFTFLKKGLVATIFVIFGFVGTYIPQDWNKVEQAHAGFFSSGGGQAKEVTQLVNMTQLLAVNIATTASWALDKITSFATHSIFTKDYVLDGATWALAKAFVSAMVQSLINWINSGFKGSPMFIQDLQGFLIDVADKAVGEYIDELGGLGSFICSPFRLDVQIAVALQYSEQTRTGQPAPDCTLTGIIDNLEGFISGEPGSFSEGGWNDWFDVTSSPEMYTPYGAVLAAQTGAQIRILNAQGEKKAELNWGAGFLSGEICQMVHGAGSSKEECFISKPGKIIQEALTFNLDSGRQSLIEADEIDELLGALLGQLANKALTGAAGLLGLSSGTSHTYTGYNGGSYLDEMTKQQFGNTGELLKIMQDALTSETDFHNTAQAYKPQLQALAANSTSTAISTAITETTIVITNTTANISNLNDLIADFTSPTATSEQKLQTTSQFYDLSLYTTYDINASKDRWEALLN